MNYTTFSGLKTYLDRLIWAKYFLETNPNWTPELNEPKSLINPVFMKEFIGHYDWKSTISNTVNQMYILSCEQKIFWEFCSLDTYSHTYLDRYNQFTTSFIDATEGDFWSQEHDSIIKSISENDSKNTVILYKSSWTGNIDWRIKIVVLKGLITEEVYSKLYYSQRAKLKYVIEKQSTRNQNTPPPINDSDRIKWQGTNVEIVEIIKGLIESKKFDPTLTEKDVFERFSNFLKFHINQKKGLENISDKFARGANGTNFIDKVASSLSNWFDQKEDRKSKNR